MKKTFLLTMVLAMFAMTSFGEAQWKTKPGMTSSFVSPIGTTNTVTNYIDFDLSADMKGIGIGFDYNTTNANAVDILSATLLVCNELNSTNFRTFGSGPIDFVYFNTMTNLGSGLTNMVVPSSITVKRSGMVLPPLNGTNMVHSFNFLSLDQLPGVRKVRLGLVLNASTNTVTFTNATISGAVLQ